MIEPGKGEHALSFDAADFDASMRPDSTAETLIKHSGHRIELFEARPEHVRALLPRLRDDDRSEIEAAGISCNKALWRAWRASHLRTGASVDGEIAALWGCAGGLIDPIGRPWLLTAGICEKVPLAFVKIGRAQMLCMLAVHPTLRGYVWARYWRAVRTLAMWGFRLGPLVKLNGAEFLEYTMGRG